MRAIWRTLYQRAGNFALALILAISTLTAVGPFISSQTAAAASAFVQYPFTSGELSQWTPDRTTPSGGYSSVNFGGRSNVLEMGVDTENASPSAGFYRTEGLKRSVIGTNTIRADIYVDSSWYSQDVRAGLWGVAHDSTTVDNTTISAYPIVEFVSGNVPGNSGYTGWRTYNTVTGAWTNLATAYTPDAWNTLEITLNTVTDKFEYRINGAIQDFAEGNGSLAINSAILNSFNNANNNASYNYAARWSNFTVELETPDAPTNLRFIKDSTSAVIANGSTVNDPNLTLRWDTVANAERYQVRVTDPSGFTQSDRYTGWYTFDLNDGTRHGFFGSQQGLWTYELRTKDATTGLWSDWTTPVSLNFDSVAPSTVVTANTVALPANAPTDPTVFIPGANPTTFQATLTDTGSGAYGAYIELFKANYDGTYGNWVKDNTSGAGNVRYGASPKLVYDTSALNGRYGLKIVSRDNTGNSVTTYHFFTVDSDAPTISIKSGASMIDGSSSTDPYTYISFKLYDVNGNLKEVSINGHLYNRGGTWNDLNWSNINPAHVLQGTNTVIVRDLAGNESTLYFNYDTEAPQISLVSPADEAIVKGASLTQEWSSTSSDVVKYIYRSYNDAAGTDLRWEQEFSSATTSKTALNVADATFWWEVTAVDAAGNESTSPLWKLVVDNTAPVVELTAPTGTLFNTDVEVRGSATDSNLRHYWVKVTRDGTTVYNETVLSTGITDELLYTATAEGEYVVTFAARDTTGGGASTGNRSDDVVKTFTIDKTAPTISVIGGDLTLELGESYVELGATSIDSVDGVGVVTDITGLVDDTTVGVYTVTYTITDAAGNTATAQRIVTIVDTTNPTVVLGTSTTSGNVITPSITADDLSQPLSYAWTQTAGLVGGVTVSAVDVLNPSFTVTTDGTYTFLLTVTDAQGNESTQEFGFTYTTPTTTDDEDDNDGDGDGGFTGTTPPTPAPAVLGDTTDNTPEGDSDVEGVSTENTDTVAAVDTNNDGKIFGLAWYWWLLILAALAAIAWWIAAALRRRNEEN